uniref:Uncharacterized protein n=1 Tax=Anguilla anguilla TaxID=7936 RepID=A0A0E9T0Q7_ANGAN
MHNTIVFIAYFYSKVHIFLIFVCFRLFMPLNANSSLGCSFV